MKILHHAPSLLKTSHIMSAVVVAIIIATTADATNTMTTKMKMTVEPIAYEDPYHDLGDNATATTATALLGYMSVPKSVIEDPTKQVPAVIILPVSSSSVF